VPLQAVTEEIIRRALGAINNRAYLPYIDPTRRSKLAPLLNGRGLDQVFRVPNNFVAVYARSHIGERNVKDKAKNVTAMTTANQQDPEDRLIHVKNDPPEFGTVIHELFHWLSHKDFFAGFHASPGPNVGIVDEGITEFLTRKITAEDRTKHYQAEYLEVRQLSLGDLNVEERFLQAYFKGDRENIRWLREHVRAARRRGVRH